MRIWADNREDNRFLKKGKKIFPNMMITTLERGDFIIENNGKYLCCEHKRGDDFNASIKDKRLQAQPINMIEGFDYNFVFVEGGYQDIIQNYELPFFTEKMYNGKIASLAMKYVVPPITVDDGNHFWNMLKSFSERLAVAGEPLTKPIILPNKHDKLETRMLMCIHNMGESRATKILEKFDFWSLPEVSKEELMEIKGIGEKYAEIINNSCRKKWF